MKYIDVANKIDKSNSNEVYIDIEVLASEFNIDLDWAEQDRITAYWVGNWCCADTWVGYKMYFFDDEPVAFSYQLARKSDEEVQWFSLEKAEKVKEYILSLIVEDNEINVTIVDMEEDMGDAYTIDFSGNLLSCNRPMLNGVPVEIVERIKHTDLGIDRNVRIKDKNGDESVVDVRDLQFGIYVNE